MGIQHDYARTAVLAASKSSIPGNFLYSVLIHIEILIRKSVFSLYDKFFGTLGSTTPILAFVFLALIVLRCHFKRQLTQSLPGPITPVSSFFDWKDVSLRGLFIFSAFLLDKVALWTIRGIHAAKLRHVSSFYKNELEGFVFDLTKLFSFLLGR